MYWFWVLPLLQLFYFLLGAAVLDSLICSRNFLFLLVVLESISYKIVATCLFVFFFLLSTSLEISSVGWSSFIPMLIASTTSSVSRFVLGTGTVTWTVRSVDFDGFLFCSPFFLFCFFIDLYIYIYCFQKCISKFFDLETGTAATNSLSSIDLCVPNLSFSDDIFPDSLGFTYFFILSSDSKMDLFHLLLLSSYPALQ